MELQHMRYLTTIERTGSITRAAKELYMSQPNLSRAVKDVERETGFPIFRRTPHGVEPTGRGVAFLDYARRILSQIDEMESLYKAPAQPVVSMDVSVPAAAGFSQGLSAFLGGLPEKAPLDVRFRETTSLEAISNVSGGQSRFGIIRYNHLYRDYFDSALQNARLTGETLRSFRMCLILAASHPLVPCGEVPYHLLDGFTEVVYGDLNLPAVSFTKISYGAKMKEDRRQIHVYDSGTQYQLLQAVPGAYLWSAPMPFRILAEHGLVQKECSISDGLCSDVIIFPDQHPLEARERALVAMIQKHAIEPAPLPE